MAHVERWSTSARDVWSDPPVVVEPTAMHPPMAQHDTAARELPVEPDGLGLGWMVHGEEGDEGVAGLAPAGGVAAVAARRTAIRPAAEASRREWRERAVMASSWY
jgi:hypothetical protein